MNILNFAFLLDWNNNKNLINKKNYPDKNNKIVFVMFDELDFRVLNDGNYDNFEYILSKSDVYLNAIPSGDATLTIIPSILTGSELPIDTKYYNYSNNEISYTSKEGKNKNLSEQENIFNFLDNNKYKIGLIGIYHRYCNIFYKNMNECFELNDEQYNIKNLKFKKYLIYSLLDFIPGNNKFKIFEKFNSGNFNSIDQPNLRIQNIKKYFEYLPNLIENNDFIFVHIPLPHAPWIYYKGNFEIKKYDQLKQEGYYDNMILTDNFLGEIINKLKQSNSNEKSTLILTSDHGWRVGDKKYLGSNLKTLDNRKGDILLSVKNINQTNRINIKNKIFNHEMFNLIKKMVKSEN